MKKVIIALVGIKLAVLFIGIVLIQAAQAEDRINTLSDCITETAIAEGYAGDPYSKDAWITFQSVCTTPAE